MREAGAQKENDLEKGCHRAGCGDPRPGGGRAAAGLAAPRPAGRACGGRGARRAAAGVEATVALARDQLLEPGPYARVAGLVVAMLGEIDEVLGSDAAARHAQ